jgi:hypothetical protein
MGFPVHRDPFARGAFDRTCEGPGECAWCGEKWKRVYRYVWIGDDQSRPSIFARHQADHTFCNFQCFASYHS